MTTICTRCGKTATLALRQSVYSLETYGPNLELDGKLCLECCLLSINDFVSELTTYANIQAEKLATKKRERELAQRLNQKGGNLSE